eukprot:13865618-Heterocapsa_arctica.AAC.1
MELNPVVVPLCLGIIDASPTSHCEGTALMRLIIPNTRWKRQQAEGLRAREPFGAEQNGPEEPGT